MRQFYPSTSTGKRRCHAIDVNVHASASAVSISLEVIDIHKDAGLALKFALKPKVASLRSIADTDDEVGFIRAGQASCLPALKTPHPRH